jgi:hypothetical protein
MLSRLAVGSIQCLAGEVRFLLGYLFVVLDAALFDNSFFILISTLTLRLVDLFEYVLDGGAGGETFMVLDLPLPSFLPFLLAF